MAKIIFCLFSFMFLAGTAYELEPLNEQTISNHRKIYNGHIHKDLKVPRGIVPTVFTPLHHDGSVDYEAIPPYAKYLVHHGIKAVLVGGTTGEHMSLNVETRKRVIEEWVKIGKEIGLYIMAQVGAAPFADVQELTRFCVKIGVDAIMTLPELYWKPRTVDDLVLFVSLVAHEAPMLPVLYYHNPNNTDVTVPMPQFAAAATKRIANFMGIKFSSPNLVEADQTYRTLKKDQVLYIAPELEIGPAAFIGISDVITPILNVFPQLAQAIIDAVEDKNLNKAKYLQLKLSLAADAINAEGSLPAMKATMEVVTGLKMGPPALPLKPISHAALMRIERNLRDTGLI